MIRILTLVTLLIFSTYVYSQKKFDHELQLSETKFALESQIHGLKWGFLHNMDTGALGLNRQGFNNLYKIWAARPDAAGFVLLWKPSVGFWSTDGLFGVTSGPSYTKPPTDSVLNHTGYFFTIWQREKLDVPFKISVDIGIGLPKAAAPDVTRDAPVKLYPIVQKNEHGRRVKASVDSGRIFSGFADLAAAQSLKAALESYTNDNTHIMVTDNWPLHKSELDKAAKLANKFQFSKINAKVLGASCYYEWGSLTQASDGGAVKGNFLHVWTLETGKPALISALYRFD